jgi:roadblock/LC7 domain-containing protein
MERMLYRRRLVMRVRRRWLYLIAGLAAAFVAVSSIALAVRQDSWAPIVSVGWIPAVIAASAGSRYRLCLPRRSGQAK